MEIFHNFGWYFATRIRIRFIEADPDPADLIGNTGHNLSLNYRRKILSILIHAIFLCMTGYAGFRDYVGNLQSLQIPLKNRTPTLSLQTPTLSLQTPTLSLRVVCTRVRSSTETAGSLRNPETRRTPSDYLNFSFFLKVDFTLFSKWENSILPQDLFVASQR